MVMVMVMAQYAVRITWIEGAWLLRHAVGKSLINAPDGVERA